MKLYFILNNLKLVQLFISNEINEKFLYLKQLIIKKNILCRYFVIDNNVSKPILIVVLKKVNFMLLNSLLRKKIIK